MHQVTTYNLSLILIENNNNDFLVCPNGYDNRIIFGETSPPFYNLEKVNCYLVSVDAVTQAAAKAVCEATSLATLFEPPNVLAVTSKSIKNIFAPDTGEGTWSVLENQILIYNDVGSIPYWTGVTYSGG